MVTRRIRTPLLTLLFVCSPTSFAMGKGQQEDAPHAQGRRAESHGQDRPPAPPVSKAPPLPILQRYEGELPDPTMVPILLPLLEPHGDVKDRNEPPRERWSSLDTAPRSFPHRDWQCTTHTFPAAYPRSHAASTGPHSQTYPARDDFEPAVAASSDDEKKQRRKHLQEYHGYITRNPPMSYHPARTQGEAQERAQRFKDDRQPQLWNVINRYASANDRADADADADGLTLIFGHGTGLHKETWEPAMQAILARTSTPVRECWSIDMVMCGQSCVLNGENLGEVVHMHDHARDLINFVTNFLDGGGDSKRQDVLTRRDHSRRRPRRIGLIAHSVSASMWAIASHLHPDLFESVALIDATSLKYTPEIALERSGMLNGGGSQIVAISRREAWMSREAAVEAMRTNRVYAKWERRCLDSFLKYGLRQGSRGGNFNPPTLLACPKRLEAAGYRSIWLASYTWACFRERARQRAGGDANNSNRQIRLPRLYSLRIANTFLLNEEQGEEYHRLIEAAGGTVETWGGKGEEHLIVETEPERLGERLARWLDQDEGAGTRGNGGQPRRLQREAKL